jgi:hypothetical protein
MRKRKEREREKEIESCEFRRSSPMLLLRSLLFFQSPSKASSNYGAEEGDASMAQNLV